MTNRSKDVGTKAESAVVAFLRENGWPHAERRALTGSTDRGDITGTPSLCWEVKGGKAAETASDGQVLAWLDETDTERRNAHANIGILVMKRKAIGPSNAGQWWAVMWMSDLSPVVALRGPQALFVAPVRLHLATAVQWLHAAGYGTPEVAA